jgi:membrane protein
MKALFDTLNIVHGEDEKRGFIKLNAISLLFTVGGVLFVVAALGSIVVIPVILNYVGFSNSAEFLLQGGRWPAMFLVLAFALAIIYRYGPSREAPRWRWITWGSAIAALLWIIVSGGFSWYAANFGNFNATYGSLGAVVGFMTNVALDLRHRYSDWGRDRRRDGASNGSRHHNGIIKAHGRARGAHGGHRRGVTGRMT